MFTGSGNVFGRFVSEERGIWASGPSVTLRVTNKENDSNLALTKGLQLQVIELFCGSAECDNPV